MIGTRLVLVLLVSIPLYSRAFHLARFGVRKIGWDVRWKEHMSRSGNVALHASDKAYEQYLAAKRASDTQLKEERVQREYHRHLDAIAAGDDDAIRSIGSIDQWMNFAANGITISENGYSSLESSPLYNGCNAALNTNDLEHTRKLLDYRGFTIVNDKTLKWEEYDVNFAAFAETMSNLVAAGWPPVFIFLYDQPWKMCLRLFDLMGPILNDDDATLEASMYAWSLDRQPEQKGPVKEKVGANFGVPHRDITFKNCHSEDGSPDILSLWIPIVDVNLDNGCMYCIPRECDPQFSIDALPKDQDPFSHRFQYASVRPLAPAVAGSTLIWHPNLIHWGSACSFSSELPPRKSIAMAFRVKDSRRESTEKEVERYGRVPFTRRELLQGGPDFKARLRMIVKALILYNVWYPTYDGLDIQKIDSSLVQ